MPAPAPAAQQRAYTQLSALSDRDLRAIWAKLNLAAPDKLAEPLSQVLQEIAAKYGSAAASLTADWYDEARDDAGAAGSFRALPATLPDPGRFDTLARWGVGPLFGAAPNPLGALSLIGGGLQRIIFDAGRDTSAGSAALDPAKPTWARHASANACAFCAMLATRGAAYSSEEAASLVGHSARGRVRTGGTRSEGMKYHDDCHCVAVVVWPGQEYQPAPYVAQWEKAYIDAHGSLDQMRASGGFKDSPTK